ncbi:MAG: metallophosphoesterase [Verrucomicrobiota bacterium]
MKYSRSIIAQCGCLVFVLLALVTGKAAAQTNAPGANTLAFIAAGDMRKFVSDAPAGKRYFDGLCEAASRIGGGAFMISPGDCDPPAPIRVAIDRYLGTNYIWYPVIGNHDADSPADMDWMRHWADAGIPHLIRRGPPGAELTTFSYDFGNSHFIVFNEYYDGKSDAAGKGDIPDAASAWLETDLAATRQSLIWVIGHKPIKSLPDMDSGRERHNGDSISSNPAHFDRFIQLLTKYHVRAYICGHTHNCSVAKVHGVWQTDSGHARGAGDTGSPSTFLKFRIADASAWVDIYRSDKNGVEYKLEKTVELN